MPAAVAGGGWAAATHGEALAQIAQACLGLAIGVAAWAGWTAGEFVVLGPHRRDRIIPLGWAVRHELGSDADIPAVRFIHWDHNFGNEGTEIRVMLPRRWIRTNEQRNRLTRAVLAAGSSKSNLVTMAVEGHYGVT